MDVFLMIQRHKTTIFTDAKELSTMFELKFIVKGILKWPRDKQQLYKDDQLLDDGKTLGECGFTSQTAQPQSPATVGLAFQVDDALESLCIEPFSSPPELPNVMKPQDSGGSANEQAVQCPPVLKSSMDLDVVNMFVIAGGTLAIPILAFVASFLLWPSALIRIYYWYWRRTLGMQVRYVHHEDYQFCYSFRGRPGHKPSILMLHGFSAHKDMWLSVVKFLPKNLHLVCVDMPGHEGTTRSSLDDLSIDGQVKRVHQFVECLKLNKKPFHLIGTSMGGHVAGVYAAYYPSDVCSLCLVCPAGLQYSTDNQFVQRLKELQDSAAIQKIPLIPSTPEEMSEMLQLCSYVRFKVPQQ
ncbi:hypothetical protein STEG23_032280, partial [Scotinomys teguina]